MLIELGKAASLQFYYQDILVVLLHFICDRYIPGHTRGFEPAGKAIV